MISRNQLAAELMSLTQKYMIDGADDSQGFADEVLVMLYDARRDALLGAADFLAAIKVSDGKRWRRGFTAGVHAGVQSSARSLRKLAGGQR